MLSRFRAPLLFFLLGSPIAFYSMDPIRLGLSFKLEVFDVYMFLMVAFITVKVYVYGFAYSFGAGVLFSTLGNLYQMSTGRHISLLRGGTIGALSGAFANFMAFGDTLKPEYMIPAALAGAIAGLVCGLLYTYQCDGRFVPIWGDAARRDAEDAAANTKLSKFLRLKSDDALDGPHGPCPSCNAFIAQNLAECPGCKASLTKPTPQA